MRPHQPHQTSSVGASSQCCSFSSSLFSTIRRTDTVTLLFLRPRFGLHALIISSICARPFRRPWALLCRMPFSTTPTHVNKKRAPPPSTPLLALPPFSCWLCSDTRLVYAYLCRRRSAAGRHPHVHRVMTAALFAAVPAQAGHHAVPHSPTIPQ
jgi:hypothetical protein